MTREIRKWVTTDNYIRKVNLQTAWKHADGTKSNMTRRIKHIILNMKKNIKLTNTELHLIRQAEA